MEHFITIVLWIISSYCSAAYASHGKVLYTYVAQYTYTVEYHAALFTKCTVAVRIKYRMRWKVNNKYSMT